MVQPGRVDAVRDVPAEAGGEQRGERRGRGDLGPAAGNQSGVSIDTSGQPISGQYSPGPHHERHLARVAAHQHARRHGAQRPLARSHEVRGGRGHAVVVSDVCGK